MKNLLVITLSISMILSISLPTTLQAVPFEGSKIAMSAPSPYAISAGKAIAKQGGNVVDVAVAMGLTLSVTSPYFAALGGGGFALIKMNSSKNLQEKNSVKALDFRETAPAITNPEYFVKNNKSGKLSRNGGKAIGVPGFLAGLWEMHQKYGKLPWSTLFTTPIELAANGFQISGEWAKHTLNTKPNFNSYGLKHFFKENKKPYLPGEILKQNSLANALKLIQKKGPRQFYDGIISKDIVDSIKKSGGEMTLEDLKNYKVRWLKPLTTNFYNYKVHLMPPPSSGGIVIKTALNLIEQMNLKKHKPFSVEEFHLLGEIMSRSFRGRALLGDPDFHENPIAYLTNPKYITKLKNSIHLKKSTKLKPLDEKLVFANQQMQKQKESTETTHFTVLDSNGQSVALTVTLNGRYGSGVVSDKFGIALNNEMDDFTTRPGKPNMFGLIQGSGNLVQPGKRPLSSMSPTLVEEIQKDGSNKVIMSLGSPGGPRIINAVLQVLYRSLITGLDIDKAIQAPRVHHQFLPRILFVDENRVLPETIKGLEKRGHKVSKTWIARVYAARLKEDGILEAAFDSRGEGAAGGF